MNSRTAAGSAAAAAAGSGLDQESYKKY